jgi:hypothetical protein
MDPPLCGEEPTDTPATGVERIAVVQITPGEDALDAALMKCGLIETERREEVLCRLVELPASLREPIDQRRGLFGASDSKLRNFFKPDGDTLAQLLCLNHGQLGAGATWKALSRAERMAARRLWDWFADLSDSSTYPKGRPAELDAALVLYLGFVLQEALGRRKFGYSTAADSSRRGGPMLRALMAALNVHVADERRQQVALDCLGPIGVRETPALPIPATVLRVVKLANAQAFRTWADRFAFPLTSTAVADHPAEFRHLVALVARRRKPRVTD